MNLPEKAGLRPETILKIREVFTSVPQIESAILYGSRALGTYKPGSDIDLTLKGSVDLSLLYKVEGALDDLMLPYKFDLSVFSQLDHAALIEHIQRVGIIFYQRADLAIGG